MREHQLSGVCAHYICTYYSNCAMGRRKGVRMVVGASRNRRGSCAVLVSGADAAQRSWERWHSSPAICFQVSDPCFFYHAPWEGEGDLDTQIRSTLCPPSISVFMPSASDPPCAVLEPYSDAASWPVRALWQAAAVLAIQWTPHPTPSLLHSSSSTFGIWPLTKVGARSNGLIAGLCFECWIS
jgi:hypothetical protein